MFEKRPSKLHWYRSLVGERRAWAKETVVDSVVYLSAPESYNDPFEFRHRVSFRAERATKVAFFKKAAIEQGLDPEAAERKAETMADPGMMTDEEFETHMERTVGVRLIDDWRGRTGVISLSAQDDHALMWAHYADSHRGIGLEFDTDVGEGRNPFSAAFPVHYQSAFPVLAYFEDDEVKQVRTAVLTKSDDWRYEREWRVVLPDRARQKLAYPRPVLTAVTLGARVSEEDEKQVREWLTGRPEVQLRRARLAAARYAIEIGPA